MTQIGDDLQDGAQLDDARLVSAVLQRDRKAMAEFVSRHTDSVYGYVRHRLAPRTDLVDDLVQEVFLAALKGLHGFSGRSSLRSWLLGIARLRVATLRVCGTGNGRAELIVPLRPGIVDVGVDLFGREVMWELGIEADKGVIGRDEHGGQA